MSDRHARQSFLGERSEEIMRSATVGIIGLGGGGSHVAQQLAHVGLDRLIVVDHDRIDATNLNRLVGGTAQDVRQQTWKTAIARRLIESVNPGATVTEIRERWQVGSDALRACDIIVGCLDSYVGRSELEAFSRRFLIPYLDLGMDVFEIEGRFAIAGQVTLSMPGHPCTRCMGVIREEWLSREAADYGAAGGKPQVVWPNGLLASAAVGTLIQLMTPWHDEHRPSLLLEYDGNAQQLTPGAILAHLPDRCPHFEGIDSVGDPWFTMRSSE